jgi:oxysterol-binding protein-related protein 9/10/11
VLKWFLAALKQQQYAGRDEKDGVKKPLNAFLGELFLASREGAEGIKGTTRLVSEQVRYLILSQSRSGLMLTNLPSHHPPVTACYLWNDEHGIRVSPSPSTCYSKPPPRPMF